MLAVLPFDTIEEALDEGQRHALRPRGLDLDARRVHARWRPPGSLDFGHVQVNDHLMVTSEMPHGGFKQSGSGKDMSSYSFEEYTRVKHVMLELTGEPEKPLALHDLRRQAGRWVMTGRSNREVVEAYGDALKRGDFDAAVALLDPDVTDDYPQSGERIRGRDAFREVLTHYPGGEIRTARVDRIVGSDDKLDRDAHVHVAARRRLGG